MFLSSCVWRSDMSSSQTGVCSSCPPLPSLPSDHVDGQCSFAGGDDPCLSYASVCPETWQPRQLRGEKIYCGFQFRGWFRDCHGAQLFVTSVPGDPTHSSDLHGNACMWHTYIHAGKTLKHIHINLLKVVQGEFELKSVTYISLKDLQV